MAQSQLVKGVLPTLILAILAEGDTYGYDVLRRLKRAGLKSIGDASVYGTLERLFEEGFVSEYRVAPSAGPSRRYFSLSAVGWTELKSGAEEWREFQSLVNSVLAEAPEL